MHCSGGIQPEGKSCLCSQCSETLARGQTVQIGSVLGLRGPERIYQTFSSLWRCEVLEVRQEAPIICNVVVLMSDLVAEPNQTVIDEHRTDLMAE